MNFEISARIRLIVCFWIQSRSLIPPCLSTESPTMQTETAAALWVLSLYVCVSVCLWCVYVCGWVDGVNDWH